MTQTQGKALSGWLVASDIDGTLNNKARKLPPRNLDAIRRFTQELGGHFTLASGRSVPSMEKHFRRLPIEGTPAVVLNGAGIYDFSKREMLRFTALDEAGMEFVKEVFGRHPMLEVQICTADMIYMVHPLLFGRIMLKADHLPHVFCKDFTTVPKNGWGKVIFMGLPSLIKKVVEQTKQIENPPVNFMSSSIITYELLAKGTHKGTAVLQLADMLGVPHTQTGAIGDYFNDYDMLKTVSVPAVCAQAPPEMHKIAEYVSCHCNQGAVANFLEYLEKTYA